MLQKQIRKSDAKKPKVVTDDPKLKALAEKAKQTQEKLPDEVGQVLLKAAEIIREKGWCRDNLQSYGRVCLLGAVGRALDPDRPLGRYYSETEIGDTEPAKRLGKFLTKEDSSSYVLSDHPSHRIPHYNDDKCPNSKTAAEMLEKAAFFKE